ncbi:MAG: protein-glutamate O-methyltransferase CheR [Cyanobacteriota bacterium]
MNQNNITEIYNSNFNNVNFQTSKILNTDFIFITDLELSMFSNLIYNKTGIKLDNKKKEFFNGRLQKRLKDLNFKNFSDYYKYVILDLSGQELSNLVDLIATNHTYFNREKDHFEFLINIVLPEITEFLKNNNLNDLRIWCAGCSTGEEAYTLAMILLEFFGDKYFYWKAGLLATDISEKALKIAKHGVYSDEQLEKLPLNYRKYFSKLSDGKWLISEKVRVEVEFRRFNLINDNFPFKKPFHIIFCRNVMIYFDFNSRKKLIKEFRNTLIQGGYLFVGHSESLFNEQDLFKYIKPAVYRSN